MGTQAPKSGDLADLFVRGLVSAAAPQYPLFAIRTMPRAERQVRDRLEAFGFSPVGLRFFTGFLFLRFHPSQRLQIGSIAGVHSIVGIAARPLPVDLEELEAMQRVADSRLPIGPAPFPATGRPCRLTSGPLEGVCGVVMGTPEKPVVILSLSLLQRSIAVSVEPEWIGPYRPLHMGKTRSPGEFK